MSLVSIVIPVYNAEKYLDDTIQSVLSQTYAQWELIAVNDGSKDNSLIILQKWQNLHPTKIKIFSKSNSGVSDTRNFGISKANGEFIALLDADDFWLNNNLETKINYLLQHQEIDFTFSDMYQTAPDLSNPQPAPFGKDENILEDLLLWNGEVIPGPSSNLVIRRKCFDNGIKFKKNLSTIADQNLCVQLAYYFKGKRIPELLWYYRVLPGSMSKSVKVMDRDCNATYMDYWKSNYFHSRSFQLKCFSNMYLIVAGSYWKDAHDKWNGIYYLLKSLFFYPANITVIFNKIKYNAR